MFSIAFILKGVNTYEMIYKKVSLAFKRVPHKIIKQNQKIVGKSRQIA